MVGRHGFLQDFSNFGTKGGRKISDNQVNNLGLKAKEYLGFELLVGEEGNSFYGSKFGNPFCCSVEGWFRWIFNDNDNCKVNDIGNDNGNGREAL